MPELTREDRALRRALRGFRAPQIWFNCEHCGAMASKLPSEYKKQERHFCSLKCWNDWKALRGPQGKVTIKCANCGIKVEKWPCHLVRSSNVFCSKKCAGEWRSKNMNGKKATLYIDGRTPLKKLIKNSSHYDAWRRQVLEAGGYKCSCGATGYLHIHHKTSFSDLMDSFYEDCVSCGLDTGDPAILLPEAHAFSSFWDVDNGELLCPDCHSKTHPDVNLMAKRRRENALACA